MGGGSSSPEGRGLLEIFMDSIPSTNDKTFLSERALGILQANPDEVLQGIYAPFIHGEKKIVRLRCSGLDRPSLTAVAKSIRDKWNVELRVFEPFLDFITNEALTFKNKFLDEIITSSDNTKFLFVNVRKNEAEEYEIALCYYVASASMNTPFMLGGLIKEGLLGKDEQKLYLLF